MSSLGIMQGWRIRGDADAMLSRANSPQVPIGVLSHGCLITIPNRCRQGFVRTNKNDSDSQMLTGYGTIFSDEFVNFHSVAISDGLCDCPAAIAEGGAVVTGLVEPSRTSNSKNHNEELRIAICRGSFLRPVITG